MKVYLLPKYTWVGRGGTLPDRGPSTQGHLTGLEWLAGTWFYKDGGPRGTPPSVATVRRPVPDPQHSVRTPQRLLHLLCPSRLRLLRYGVCVHTKVGTSQGRKLLRSAEPIPWVDESWNYHSLGEKTGRFQRGRFFSIGPRTLY